MADVTGGMGPEVYKSGNTVQVSDEIEGGIGRRLGSILSIGRSGSPAPSTSGSLKSAKSAKSIRTNKSIQFAKVTGFYELDSIPDDELPDDKKELEEVLNWHLSELNYLEKHINEANENFNQNLWRIQACHDRGVNQHMPKAMKVKSLYVTGFRHGRDLFQIPVAYHRNELNRIRDKRIKMNRDTGLDTNIPDFRINDDAIWEALFSL